MEAISPVQQAANPETANVFNQLNEKMEARAEKPVHRSPLRSLIMGALLFTAGFGVASWISARRSNAPIAIVNGEAITQPEFTHRMEVASSGNASVGPTVLRQMISEKLALQFAAKQGVLPESGQVDAKYAEASKAPTFADNLKKSGQTPDDIKQGIRVNLAQQAVIGKGVEVTDADVQNFYNVNSDPKNPQARYYRREAVQIAAIITDKPADVQAALHDLASGVSWAQAAAKYSKDQSKANNGVLPAIRRGTMDAKKFPGLEARFFAMNPGQQIDNIKAGGAMWIVRCVGKQAEERIPFDKVKEECRQGAMLAKGINTNGQKIQSDNAAFDKEAKIEILSPQYQSAIPTSH